jgi:hypothetical protein
VSNSILLSKRQVIERLNSPLSSKDKVAFLEWQKENLNKSEMQNKDQTRYKNYINWLNTQISINTNMVDDDDLPFF